MSLEVEQLVVDRLREWLLLHLPAKVAAVNTTRAAVLTVPIAGPYTVPSGAKLFYSGIEVAPSSWTEVPITSGTRTGAELATDFNGVVPGIASVDETGRFRLTSAAAPVLGTDSLVVLGPDSTGVMAALGLAAGGEWAIRSPLICPGYKGVCDGAPLSPDMGAGFWVIIGDNASVPLQPSVRRDEYIAAVAVTIGVPVPANSQHRSRELLRAALRCVREVLFLEPGGRTLGNAPHIQLVEEKQALVKSRPVAYAELPNQLFCRAALELQVRVFERQAD